MFGRRTFTLAAFVAALAVLASGPAATAHAAAVVSSCHNSTGSCTTEGFVCANSELISADKRCDGVEDCADGTDEYMCHLPPAPLEDHERRAEAEVSCVKCFCRVGSITVTSTQTAWMKVAFASPRDFNLMTLTGTGQSGRGCSEVYTTSVTLAVFKKQNKGCRGWVCCFRQTSCNTCSSSKLPAKQCNA
jgi:hypothetical protein